MKSSYPNHYAMGVQKKKQNKTKRKLVEKVAIIGSYIVQLNLDKIEMSK